MHIVCSDLEGVFVPEIWVSVAERTGIDDLRLTTRDIADYDRLMQKRLGILAANALTIRDIQQAIAAMEPLDGAVAFLDWLRRRVPVIIVSDTFEQFAGPLRAKLGWPDLFCNTLELDAAGRITGYRLRQSDGKRKVVKALQSLNYEIIATGDSYNDVTMLQAADCGILFQPPPNIKSEFAQLPVAETYDELKALIEAALSAGSR
jgi:phosphoserine/homoserine phosphotransferase